MKEALAPGAPALDGSIPLCVPEIQGNEWAYIKDCLDTNWVSSVGSFVDRFEQSIRDFLGADHAVATTNGTAALHVALLVAGVGLDDEVIVPALTFVAPANAVRYVGAWPVFIDSEPDYWQMDPTKLEGFLDRECSRESGSLVNKTTGRRVKAILPVHVLGHPCDMDPIVYLARKHDLRIVEDATESLGSKYEGTMVGRHGDISCFSFNGNKLITTGGGGMIVTDNQEWAEKAHYLTTQAKDDPVEYVHNEIGYNYRLTNIQAAMGVAQMERLDEFIEKKKAIAARYEEGFKDCETISTMATQPGAEPTYWLNTILLDATTTVETRKDVVRRLNEGGIGVRPLWHPLHQLPPFAGCYAFEIECAVNLYARGISLPSSVGLSQSDQQRCIAAVKEIVLV